MTDLLEQRLAEAARRWQAEQPPPPAVPLDRLDEPVRRPRRGQMLIGAAAAVLVAVGGVAALTRSHGDSAAPPPVTGSSTAHVEPQPDVPWRDLPAAHPHVRHRVHGHVVTPFDRVSATGSISGRVHPGDTLVFVAVLESSTDLPLDPCPDFSIAFGTKSWHTWQLNCGEVPFRDSQGRPYLPAFKDVRFEMRVTVPDERGRQKVLWTLDGPQQLPGFYGLVTVERP